MNSVQYVYWVNSSLMNCESGEPKCLAVQKGEAIDETKWMPIARDAIKGFSYQDGYIYKLLVSEAEQKIDKEKVMVRTLVEVVEKNSVEEEITLHGHWKFHSIMGEKIDEPSDKAKPLLRFNTIENSLQGFDSCNQIFGDISVLDKNSISFAQVGGTKKMCPRMDIANNLRKAMASVAKYKIEGKTIYFYDGDGNNVMEGIRFKN